MRIGTDLSYRGAYKAPRMNTPVIAAFLSVDIFKPQTCGIGRIRIITSMKTPEMLVAKK